MPGGVRCILIGVFRRPVSKTGNSNGGPSFRDSSRPVLDAATIAANQRGITNAFVRYLGADVPVVDNADWLDGLGYLEFLRNVGRRFSVNRMLTFDAIRTRLEHSLSFLEFGYTLLQAYDFVELAGRHGCTLQIGGADQWANIINGVDLGRRQQGLELFGLTLPLLATSDGRKMGKSTNGAVWLNADRLAPFRRWPAKRRNGSCRRGASTTRASCWPARTRGARPARMNGGRRPRRPPGRHPYCR